MSKIYINQDSQYVLKAFNDAPDSDKYKRMWQGETYIPARWGIWKLKGFFEEHGLEIIRHQFKTKSEHWCTIYEVNEEDYNHFRLIEGPLYLKCINQESLKTYTAQVESQKGVS